MQYASRCGIDRMQLEIDDVGILMVSLLVVLIVHCIKMMKHIGGRCDDDDDDARLTITQVCGLAI